MTLIGDCYRVVHGQFSRKPSKFGWVVEGKLAASGRLMIRSQVLWVIKQGIKSIITIKETPVNEKWFEGCEGVEYRHLQVEDYGAPTMNQLIDIIEYILTKVRNEKPVIVHCNGRTGRTGTILSAYLMKSQNLRAEQAMEEVKRIRGRRPRRKEQLGILAEYERLLASQG
jgi:atypical dual specificity phosphatase